MPRRPALNIETFSELESQLRFAPREALLRNVARAEELAAEIEPTREYPMEWILFRITGFRPNNTRESNAARRGDGSEEVLRGSNILADLGPLVERLCVHAKLTDVEIPAGALTSEVLRARWCMSRATLNRLRQKGLVGRFAIPAGASPGFLRGQGRLYFDPKTVARFEQDHAPALSRATRFSRLDESTRRNVIRRAQRYARAGVSLNEAARRIAIRFGRAHETIRRILRQDTQRRRRSHPTQERGFDVFPTLNIARRRVLLRAWCWPLQVGSSDAWEVAGLSQREHRSPPAIRRALALAQAERLWSLLPLLDNAAQPRVRHGRLTWHEGPTFHLIGAGDAILAQHATRNGLGTIGPRDVGELLLIARSKRTPIPAEELARAVAYQFLLFDAARGLQSLSRSHPKTSSIDRIQTTLRWAARIKMELVRSQLRVVIDTLETRLGRRVEELGGIGVRMIDDVLLAACDGVDAFDPFRGGTSRGRVAGPVGLNVDRVATRWSKELASVPSRRAASLLSADTPISDISRRVARWQTLIEPDPRIRVAVDAGVVPLETQLFLRRRYGWAEEGTIAECVPRTLAEMVASGYARTTSQAAREERRKIREAVAAARQYALSGR